MNHQNQENVKDLFEQFAGPQEAEQAVDDIRRGENILREHPAPEPDKELLAEIKTQVRSALSSTKTGTFPRLAGRIAAVAAVLLIGALISISLFEQQPAPIPPTTIIWEDKDPELAAFSAEIEQIESDLLALQLGENGTNGHLELTELEMELMEIDADFWKG
jgi:hypothetical protein